MTIFNLARSRNTDIPDKFQCAVSSSTCDVTLTGDNVTTTRLLIPEYPPHTCAVMCAYFYRGHMGRTQRSENELAKAADYVSYEYCQVFRELDRLATSALAQSHVERGYIDEHRVELLHENDHDAHMRAHLIAVRNVIDFLSPGDRPRGDDVLARDYLPSYAYEFPERFRTGIRLFDKRAGHLTYQRGQGVAWWVGHDTGRTVYEGFADFLTDLSESTDVDGTTRASWFHESHEYTGKVLKALEGAYAEGLFTSPTGDFVLKYWTVHPTISVTPAPSRDGPELVPPPEFGHLFGYRQSKDRP